VPLSNEQVQHLVSSIYDVVGRVHRIARALVALIVVMLAALGFLYVQQNNLAEDQAATLEVDQRLEVVLRELEVAVERVDANTTSVAGYVAELRARAAADGGTNDEVARRLILIDRIALLLEQLHGPLPEPLPPPPGG
jgi:hypothetical protein